MIIQESSNDGYNTNIISTTSAVHFPTLCRRRQNQASCTRRAISTASSTYSRVAPPRNEAHKLVDVLVHLASCSGIERDIVDACRQYAQNPGLHLRDCHVRPTAGQAVMIVTIIFSRLSVPKSGVDAICIRACMTNNKCTTPTYDSVRVPC